MKTLYLFFLLAIVNVTTFSQIVFEKGYFINSEGQKVDCLIKNQDWSYNPSSFEYKISEGSEELNAYIDEVSEFGIESLGRFIRFKVKLDTSSIDLCNLSRQRNPEFKEKVLFLKILVEGDADLFVYDAGNVKKYFYGVNISIEPKVEQLIYKKYEKYNLDDLEKKAIRVFENNYFRQQLYLNLKCEDIKESALKTLSYSKKSLIKLFNKYNACKNENYLPVETNVKRDFFNLGLRVGISRSQFSVKMPGRYSRYVNYGPEWVKFDSELNIRLGLEFEFLLPFNKNKWGLFIEPTIHKYESEAKGGNYFQYQNDIAKIEYHSIEFPLGIRHYFYLDSKTKFFVNASFILDYNNGSKITFEQSESLDFEVRNNFSLGFGFNYDDDFIFEFRYHTTRDPIARFERRESKYNLYSIIVGYSLF